MLSKGVRSPTITNLRKKNNEYVTLVMKCHVAHNPKQKKIDLQVKVVNIISSINVLAGIHRMHFKL